MPGRLGPRIPAGRIRSAAPVQVPGGRRPGTGNHANAETDGRFFVYIIEEK